MEETIVAPKIMYYLTDYVKQDGTVVTFDKSRLDGIRHEKYSSQIPNYNDGYTTRYDSNLLQKDGQYAIEMESLTGLPDVFLDKVVEGVPDGSGWFVPVTE